ncbi:uncharacterized protein LOC143625216 [Bidens hawaiensis]|uniref:uncharacterized protein LOC143625216 n=1 Tax=Bidens hawaiensis TaxID=980011 RepID=UPI004048FC57
MSHMLFADDIVLIAESKQDLNMRLEEWRYALESKGLKISRSKTGYLYCDFGGVNDDEDVQIAIEGQEVPQSTKFKYLGSFVQSDGAIDSDVAHRVQAGWCIFKEKINIWVSKTTNFVNDLASPLVKNVQDNNPTIRTTYEIDDMEELLMTEHTIDTRTPMGNLSLAAIISIEQFSRMNGLTGKKMQMMFKGIAPENGSNNARNLVEYCCFRFLCRDSSEIHPCLKDEAFQRLIFVTMLAWENPYSFEGFFG